MSTAFELRDIIVHAGKREILNIPALSIADSSFVAIAGPNGAGKTTLMSVMNGLRRDFDGQCFYQNKDIRLWSRREFARNVAVVLQHQPVAFPFTAEQVVTMGRGPHLLGWNESPDDMRAVNVAMEKTGALALRSRLFRTLSGGEQQRVILASALAQDPNVLLLDEPTVYLDLNYQVQLYKLLSSLHRDGMLIVTITHDLNLAAACADRVLLLKDGRLHADGAPEDVITRETIEPVFGITVEPYVTASGKRRMHYGL